MTRNDRRAVGGWLLACAALVFAIVVLGGVTRLTRSGLSIVEWQPLIGALPPLTEAHWQELFAKYRETPEFRLVNFDMTLEGFKSIFWWEYVHRLLGRLIGVVFLLPLVFFVWKRKIDKPLAWRLGAVFVLGGLQGALGWFMVKSGLVDDPRVSHFRLTAHLGLALLIFSAQLWIALGLLSGRKPPSRGLAPLLPVLVYLMALSGGMVAGLRAGYAYNTFPLMNGHFVPPEILLLEPWWKNFGYNMAMVQFVHRGFFWLLALLIPLAWWRYRAAPAAHVLMGAFLLQATLGISTLLLRVPPVLGAAHQAGAVLLLAAALWTAHSACSSSRLGAWLRPLTAGSLALVLVVVVASAAIRLSGRDLGAWMPLVRGTHRVSAFLATLLILGVGWLAWRAGRRALAVAIVLATAGLSILGAATGTAPPAAAAAGNLVGGLLLVGLLAALLAPARGGLVFVLLAVQVCLGAWLSIFAEELWAWPLVVHALLGVALAGTVAWLSLAMRSANARLLAMALALAVPAAGAAAALFGLPLAATLAHTTGVALLTCCLTHIKGADFRA